MIVYYTHTENLEGALTDVIVSTTDLFEHVMPLLRYYIYMFVSSTSRQK